MIDEFEIKTLSFSCGGTNLTFFLPVELYNVGNKKRGLVVKRENRVLFVDLEMIIL